MIKRLDHEKLPNVIKEWDFLEIVERFSTFYKVNPYHILALIQTESKGITTAMKYEDGFKWIKEKEIPSIAEQMGLYPDTCRMVLKTSFGLGQVMGQVFIENGGLENAIVDYRNPVIMCNKRFGILYACKVFSKTLNFWGPDVATVYSAYNRGTPKIDHETKKFVNQKNVDNFLENLSWITKEVRF